ncbi:MAG: Uncharacterized MFS-type transporter, partial [uncultured Lysobacter sp.]
ERHLLLPPDLQLPRLGRGRARVQRGHVDAAHRAGLAGADPAHRPQRDGGGVGDGAAVRPAFVAAATGGLGGRSPGPPQAADVDAGGGRPACARPGAGHAAGRGAAVAGVRVRVRAGLRHGVRCAGAAGVRVGHGQRRAPRERGRAEFHLVQRGAPDRACGGGPVDRGGGRGLAVHGQRGVVCGRAGHDPLPAQARAACRATARAHAWQHAGRLPLRRAAAGPGRGAGDARADRDVRLQLRAVRLDDVGHGVRRRCQPVRAAHLGDGGRHDERGVAVGAAADAGHGADGRLGGGVRRRDGRSRGNAGPLVVRDRAGVRRPRRADVHDGEHLDGAAHHRTRDARPRAGIAHRRGHGRHPGRCAAGGLGGGPLWRALGAGRWRAIGCRGSGCGARVSR